MKVISQETFDSVVLEGVQEFENPLDVAVEDAVREFEAQGVQLANIVKNMRITDDNETLIHDIIEAIKRIKSYTDDSVTDENILSESLKTFTEQCQISLGHRVLANANNASSTLVKCINKVQSNSDLLETSLRAIIALNILNADILDAEGATLMLQLMKDWETKDDGSSIPECLALWCVESCHKHELNRQNLMNNKAQSSILNLMKGHKQSSATVKASTKAIRGFMLDDDIRQEFSKAHDHARDIVEQYSAIDTFLAMIKGFVNDETAADCTYELLVTVSRLCVRAEYCQRVVDCGGLIMINDILVSFPKCASLTRQSITLLKTICGNDHVKEEAMKSGVHIRIIAALDIHQNHPAACEAGCAAIGMLALRVLANAKELVELGAGEAVVQVMKIHPLHQQIQIFGCMAVRNLVIGIPENQAILLECNAEDVIHEALKNHGYRIKDHGMAALRDLGANVELIEQWHGKGHEIER